MRAAAILATAALTITGTLATVGLITPGTARADEVTASQNLQRDDWDSNEAGLSPATVQGSRFGQLFATKVNGQVFAQPLVVGNSVLVATENDYVYSLNRATGAVNWSRQLGSPYSAAAENCPSPTVQPYAGVTGTPVYDPGTGTLYVSGLISGPPGDDADLSTATPQADLFALDASTGSIRWQQPISGPASNAPGVTFNPGKELQRAGLLLLNGSVYMGFAGLCSSAPGYDGFVAGVNTTSHATTLWTDEAGAGSGLGGIWQGGGGLLTDGTSIFISTGNGTVPPSGAAGDSVPADLGQSVVRLDVSPSTGALTAGDFFSPGNADQTATADHDLGSGGPITLPFGTSTYPHLIATAGKDARVFLLDQDNLGGRSDSETGSTAIFTGSDSLVQNPSGTVAHGQWGHMAAMAGVDSAGNPADYIYYEGTGWGGNASMFALKFDPTNPAAPTLDNIGHTTGLFGFSSGSPVVTSNGTAASSAVVWEVYAADHTGANGALEAFSAVPASGVLQKLWSAPIGTASEFSVPATDNGQVYVGTRNDGSAAACQVNFESASYTSTDSPCVGAVYGFGLRNGALTASAATVNLGRVALGQASSASITLTNTGQLPVTITKFSAPGVPFGTPAPLTVNQSVPAGGKVSVPVTFSPQADGTMTGAYSITETDGYTPHTQTISVTGAGVTAPSGVVVPSPGGGWTLNGTARMSGTSLLLSPGWHNAAGSAVFYQPLATSGLRVTFRAQLSGTGDGMTFGLVSPNDTTVALGHNGGLLGFGGLHGIAVVLGTHKDPGFPSGNFAGIATGTTGSGSSARLSLHDTVTSIPNLRSGSHLIGIALSGSGPSRTVTVTIDGKQYIKAAVPVAATALPVLTAGTGATTAESNLVSSVALSSAAGAVPPPGGGWSYNGSAQMSRSDTDLTSATVNQAGTVVYPRAVATSATSSLTAQFQVQIGGGTGANGLTFALLSPKTATTAVGGKGGGLALSGLTGMAVALSTYPILGSTSSNFVAIVTANGTKGLSPSTEQVVSGQLRSGIHTVKVTLAGGTLHVYLDGGLVTSAKASLPATSLLAFTASTGGETDVHAIRDASLAASGW
jgi:hypothetical protein